MHAVVAGHICLDILPDFEPLAGRDLPSLLKPGALLQIGAARFSGGGPVSNTGLALHHLGIPVHLIAKLGADPYGDILKRIVKGRGSGLADGLITDPQGGVTSYSIIISNRTTDRIFLHCTGENDTFGPEDIDFKIVEETDLFHFGYPPALKRMFHDGGRDFTRVMRTAKEAGATTSLDMSLPDPNAESGQTDWRPIYQSVLPYVDVFLPSLDELLFTLRREGFLQMTARGDIVEQATPQLLEDLSSELMDMGVRIVVIKLGSRGVYIRTAAEDRLRSMGRAQPDPGSGWAGCERWIPCYRVGVVGTTGSGDSTISGFLAGLLRRTSLEEALTMAVAVGACNVEAADSLSGLRTWDETRKRVQAGWEQLPFSIHEPGWKRDGSAGMWSGPLDVSRSK
ncbi:MAG: carbohydrate kinase family protein [Anaerolineales bacterium]|nr:carbohydrate kinase family protein [Anaerolineales bacterium]